MGIHIDRFDRTCPLDHSLPAYHEYGQLQSHHVQTDTIPDGPAIRSKSKIASQLAKSEEREAVHPTLKSVPTLNKV